MPKYLKIITTVIISIFALCLMSISVYFGEGFFTWWGFDPFFSWLMSIMVVCLMDAIFQAMVFLFKSKKLSAWLIGFVWAIFFASSIIGTYIGMNHKTDEAKQNRMDSAVNKTFESPEVKTLNDQINIENKSIEGFQVSYNTEDNRWVKISIEKSLNEAKIRRDKYIDKRDSILNVQKEIVNKSEIFISAETGGIDPVLKIVLSILFGFLIDIGSCVIITFSWIFEGSKLSIHAGQKTVQSENIPTVNKIKLDVQRFAQNLQAPLSFQDKVARFYDCLVDTYNKPLYGRTSKQREQSIISIDDYNMIRDIAINIGYLKTEKKKTLFGAYWDFDNDKNIREQFIKGISGNEKKAKEENK